MTPEQHKAWLLKLLEPPTTWNWWPHVEHRANELAKSPELSHLPAVVKAEYDRIKSASKASTLQRESTGERNEDD